MRIPLLLLIISLAGCTQTPNQFILAPDQQAIQLVNVNMTQPLTVSDRRAQRGLVKIVHGEDSPQWISSDKAAQSVILSSLAKRFSQTNRNLDNTNYHVDINKMVINVNQHSLKYQSDTGYPARWL